MTYNQNSLPESGGYATQDTPDWRQDVLKAKPKVLSIADGQSVVLMFLTDGEPFRHGNFKPAVSFMVQVEGERMPCRWYVRSQALLRRIESFGKSVAGLRVKLSRYGSGLDTRYILETIE